MRNSLFVPPTARPFASELTHDSTIKRERTLSLSYLALSLDGYTKSLPNKNSAKTTLTLKTSCRTQQIRHMMHIEHNTRSKCFFCFEMSFPLLNKRDAIGRDESRLAPAF